MRILIATGLYPPDIGGPATYSKLLADKLYTQGIDVEVLPFAEVRYLPKFVRHLVYFFLVLRRGRTVDAIYAQDPLGTGFPAALAATLLRKLFFLKIVGDRAWEIGVQSYAVHDDLDVFSRRGRYVPAILFFKFIERLTCALAERIVVPSMYLKSIVSNWGVSPEKIHVIYNAFVPPLLQKEKNTLRSKHNLSGRILVSVGRLVPWKGFEGLIALLPKLIVRYPDAKLYIAGDGPFFQKLKKLIEVEHMEEYIHLLGSLDQKDLFEYIAASDVFVLNTNYEGFSHQLLEVMALGIPIVTTNAGGNKELITHGENGYFVYYNDLDSYCAMIEHIFDHGEEAQEVAASAKERVAEFNEERMLSETAELFKHAV